MTLAVQFSSPFLTELVQVAVVVVLEVGWLALMDVHPLIHFSQRRLGCSWQFGFDEWALLTLALWVLALRGLGFRPPRTLVLQALGIVIRERS